MNNHEKVEVLTIPRCDFCTEAARYDARTSLGPWAYLCAAHYARYGIALGLGWGQELILKEES
jgi:glutaredoxin